MVAEKGELVRLTDVGIGIEIEIEIGIDIWNDGRTTTVLRKAHFLSLKSSQKLRMNSTQEEGSYL